MLGILLAIGSVVLAAFAVGAVIYLAVKLTIGFLKKYRKKKNSKIMAATVKDLVHSAEKNGNVVNLDDLPDEDDIILAEYDEEEDELVQDISVAEDIDDRVRNMINDNEGIVIFE